LPEFQSKKATHWPKIT